MLFKLKILSPDVFMNSLQPYYKGIIKPWQEEPTFNKKQSPSFFKKVKAIGITILAATQSIRFSSNNTPQFVCSGLGLHLWSYIPHANAQTILLPSDLAFVPIGDEFQVNTYNASNQGLPSNSFLTGGDFVSSWYSLNQEGSSREIYFQRFNATNIIRLDSGGYVIVWHSVGQDGSATGVYGQRFNANGTMLGSEFRVNTYTLNSQSYPRGAPLSHFLFPFINPKVVEEKSMPQQQG